MGVLGAILLCDELEEKWVDELGLGGRAEGCESQRRYGVHAEKTCVPYHGWERLRVPLTHGT